MNRLNPEKQKMVLDLLVEGNSIRGTQRITGVNRRTIIRLVREAGECCQAYMDTVFQNLSCRYLECDEIWTYVAKKQANLTEKERNNGSEKGDQYIFVALDAETKLVPTFVIGQRDGFTAYWFMQKLRKRINGEFQITTDRFAGYLQAVSSAFRGQVHYATLHKNYHENGNGQREGYSPSILKRIDIRRIFGNPDRKRICTSYVERQNLTMRTFMKRFNRLTIAFSKKLDCLKGMMAIYFFHYNFMRIHNSLRVTPAMEARVVPKILDWNVVLGS